MMRKIWNNSIMLGIFERVGLNFLSLVNPFLRLDFLLVLLILIIYYREIFDFWLPKQVSEMSKIIYWY